MKMKLMIEALAVESFETAAGPEELGTVHGHAGTRPPQETCGGAETCYDSDNCATRYPDYCPEPTFELVNSCIETCDTCHVTCISCTCPTCFCP